MSFINEISHQEAPLMYCQMNAYEEAGIPLKKTGPYIHVINSTQQAAANPIFIYKPNLGELQSSLESILREYPNRTIPTIWLEEKVEDLAIVKYLQSKNYNLACKMNTYRVELSTEVQQESSMEIFEVSSEEETDEWLAVLANARGTNSQSLVFYKKLLFLNSSERKLRHFYTRDQNGKMNSVGSISLKGNISYVANLASSTEENTHLLQKMGTQLLQNLHSQDHKWAYLILKEPSERDSEEITGKLKSQLVSCNNLYTAA